MKKLKLLLASIFCSTLMLTGCRNNDPVVPPEPPIVHVTGITSSELSFSIEVGEEHELLYVVTPEDAADKSVVASSESACISIEGTKVTGLLAGSADVLLSTVDGGFSLTYSITISEPEPESISISFADKVAEYEAKGYSDVVIPDYVCADLSATLSPIEDYDGYYLIKPSTTEEMEAFVASFSSAWEDELDSYGDHYLYLGSPEPGESCPFIYVADYTAESLAGVVICFDEYTEPAVAAAFPLEEVNAYLTENALYYGFTFSQAEADAISALATSFSFVSGTDSYGYPIAYVIMDGSIVSEVLAVIDATITAAGFEYDSDSEAYINSYYCFIYAVVEEDSTYLAIN